MDILLQQIAESYLLAHASLSKLTRPSGRQFRRQQKTPAFRRVVKRMRMTQGWLSSKN